jgi:hypothetical protein
MKLALRFGAPFLALVLAAILAAGIAQAQQSCPAGYPLNTPDSDFDDVGNGTVRHIPTGLIWKRCSEGQIWDGTTCQGSSDIYTWQQAFQRADAVNAGSQGWNAGQIDWRVPNQKELSSIVERGCSNPNINLSQFPATSPSVFWSGSPIAGDAGMAWNVHFDGGYDGLDSRLNASQVRLVRVGQDAYNFDATVAAPTIFGAPTGGTVGTPYSFAPTATGAPTFGATGLPPGLSIDPATGAISGTPTNGGSFSVTMTATNAGGVATLNATIVIAGAVATPTSVPTLSDWGIALLSLLLAAVGMRMRRRAA